MNGATRTLHVLALGLWFGTVVFFTLTGLLLFQAFEELTRKPAAEREYWLPAPAVLEREPPSPRFPNPLRLEQGSRIAGVAVSKLFPWYYGVQTGAGLVALLAALSWSRTGSGLSVGRTQQVRLVVLGLALVTVGLGWWLDRVVSDLRVLRNQATDAVLLSDHPTPELIQAAEEARAGFARWHGFSLLQNFATLALVTLATALAGHLPAPTLPQPLRADTQPR
jgi:hypothetical protein